MTTHSNHEELYPNRNAELYPDHEELLTHLGALYDQGYDQNEFSECIKQCRRSLQSGIAPYWRIKIHCILVGAEQDWEKAEKWRQAGEAVYRLIPAESQNESSGNYPSTRELRACLDDVYTYQAEDAPAWFFEGKRLGEDDKDAEEASPQFDDADDAEDESEEDEDEEEDMDGLERVEAETVEDVEAVEAASSTLSAAAASVQELPMDGQQTLQGGAAVGSKESVRNVEAVDGAKKKKPSLGSRAKETWVGKQYVRWTQWRSLQKTCL